MKALFVVPSLDYSGTTTQLGLLAQGLAREGIEPLVCVLGRVGPLAGILRRGGVRVEALGRRGGWDPRGLFRLRRLLAEARPDVVHAWRPESVRALALAAPHGSWPVVVSKPLRIGSDGPALRRLDRWLLGRAARILAAGPAEADRCCRLGLPARKLTVVRPGVRTADREMAKSPCPERFLLCIGPMEAHKGHRDAIWTFDVLRRLFPELQLVLAGTGDDRPTLEGFVARVRLGNVVHFVGQREDLSDLVARAALVWVPSRADAGTTVALEAMAAGRPVVASRLPGLAEVVSDGETGFLVPPGDRTALARRSRPLLEEESLGRRFGKAGRQRARRHFDAAAFVREVVAVYREVVVSC
jgi:glycosyltransferase involved in cell wall biosynthesis